MALQKDEGRHQIIHRPWSVTARADEFDAWITQPDEDGRFAPVLVCHDVFGVTPHMQEIAKLLSRMGYVAIVPDLYYRAGEAGRAADRERAEAVAAGFGDGRLMADVEDTVDFIHSQRSFVDETRLGVVGVGMGGRLALLIAEELAHMVQSVVCVSPVLAKTELQGGEVRERTAITAAENAQAPVLAMFGGKDDLVDSGEIDEFKEALGPRGAIVTYPSAKRGYLDESSDDYDPAVAADAYGRMIGFFDAYVGSEPR